MGRSVSTARGAVKVAYTTFESDDEDCDGWDAQLDHLFHTIRKHYPSFQEQDRWAGREDRVIAQNKFCYITVSEYCGLVALSAVPAHYNEGLATSWIEKTLDLDKIAKQAFGESLTRLGTFSNGESVYERRA